MISILETAEKHYRPAIVHINRHAIAKAVIPTDIKTAATVPMKYEIENDSLFWISSIIVFNTLNYQFWDIENGAMKRYTHNGLVGALAMGACFWEAWHAAIPEEFRYGDLTQALGGTLANFRSRIETDGIQSIFGDIPKPDSRKRILLEVTELDPLLRCADQINRQLRSSTVNGEFLSKMLASYFPVAYGDIFLKKAQLTLMLATAEYRCRYPDAVVNLNVTIAADYQIPKVLRSMGILEYSDALADMVDNGELIGAGSKAELAIRAASICAGHDIAKLHGVAIPQLDWWIWSHRNDDPSAKFHLTRTTDY